MKRYFLRLSGLVMLALLLHATGFSQDNQDADEDKNNKLGDYDEIIIKPKGEEKNGKVTIEIKDGQVTVNGKPLSEFDDDNISVRRKKITVQDGNIYGLIAPGAPRSPFRGGWSYNGDLPSSNTAFLGVASEEAKGGGAEVREVTKGSAAEKLGLKKGDIITKIDDKKIENPADLSDAIHDYKPDDKIVVTYIRDGKEQKGTVTLGKTKGYSYNFKMPKMDDLNLDVNPRIYTPRNYNFNWNYSNRPKFGIKAQDTEDDKGAKVLDVDDESPAEKAGIHEGDIITQFDGKEVKNASQLAGLARESRTKSSIKVKLNRDGKSQEVEVRIPKKLNTADL